MRKWKVTNKKTGRVILVDTINRRFAAWIARSERGMWDGDLKVSVVKN